MQLTAEQIQTNWDRLRELLNSEFPTRAKELNIIYDEFEERIMMMPASGTEHFHNAMPGGYVDHILRVYDCAVQLHQTWSNMDADMSGYTLEELKFAALHHDLGKIGFPGDGNEVYVPNDSEWHRKNQGKIYKHNTNIPFTMVPDLGIWLLQHYKVSLSWNEYQAIRIHDGLYDDANKPYFISRSPESKLRVNLPILLHHADHMAALIEYGRWANKASNTPKKMPEPRKPSKTITSSTHSVDDIFKGLFDQ